jgi:hypothetical protein
MKYTVMLALPILIGLSSCRSTRPSGENIDTPVNEALQAIIDERQKAGEPTDTRLQQASMKISGVSFPTNYEAACTAIGIPPLWIAGRCTQKKEAEYIWLTFDLTGNYSISFKTIGVNMESVYDIQIVSRTKQTDK